MKKMICLFLTLLMLCACLRAVEVTTDAFPRANFVEKRTAIGGGNLTDGVETDYTAATY